MLPLLTWALFALWMLVLLNIAPLYELVPWKEAKSYWDELLEGKYEWSSIGKQLRQKGLVK